MRNKLVRLEETWAGMTLAALLRVRLGGVALNQIGTPDLSHPTRLIDERCH
jgi:hypothetical protein